jgi:hypothetical protein
VTNRARPTLARHAATGHTTDAADGAPEGPSTRARLLARLLWNDSLTLAERRSLGPCVTREELAVTIEQVLATSHVFPPRAHGRTQVRVSGPGVYLVRSRMNRRRTLELCTSVRDAVERFLDIEIGPSCGGMPVRGRRPVPPTPDGDRVLSE